MSGFEWFLLVVVVIVAPLVVAIAVTLWTLEQARQRNRRNREADETAAGPVKRQATRPASDVAEPGAIQTRTSLDEQTTPDEATTERSGDNDDPST